MNRKVADGVSDQASSAREFSGELLKNHPSDQHNKQLDHLYLDHQFGPNPRHNPFDMRDEECVGFLQWALPRLNMRWPGFRKVRLQVCKRLQRRLTALRISNVSGYCRYLTQHPEEWRTLDALTRVTISRFYRDKLVFEFIAQEVLPRLAKQASERNDDVLSIWSAGGGSGEEPYTLALFWHLLVQPQFPNLRLRIVATDADANQCQRGVRACYSYSSIKNLPAQWQEHACAQQQDEYCLNAMYRADVEFRVQDVREAVPPESFDVVFCRNLVFTYFDDGLQRETLGRMQGAIKVGGALVIGIHEHLPAESG
ncbi:MAG: hypothetical protein JSW10_03410, partial [Pseudomonadota bacterium]